MGITTKATPEKQAAAMKWIDFLFNSPESLFAQANGVEGLSYTKNADGTITKKTPAGTDWTTYVIGIGGNQPPRAHQQLSPCGDPGCPSGWRMWTRPRSATTRTPPIVDTKWTTEEDDAVSAILTDLQTYVMESVTKFIIGQTPMSQFDTFVTELNKRGIPQLQKLFDQRYQRQLSILGK